MTARGWGCTGCEWCPEGAGGDLRAEHGQTHTEVARDGSEAQNGRQRVWLIPLLPDPDPETERLWRTWGDE